MRGEHYKVTDDLYHLLNGIPSNPAARKLVSDFLLNFSRFGCPVPKNGFKSQAIFDVWNERLLKKKRRILVSREYKDKVGKITKGKTRWNEAVAVRLERLNQKMLLQMAHLDELKNLLIQLGVAKPTKEDVRRLHDQVFFNKKTNPKSVVYKLSRNKDKEMELHVQFTGSARIDDVDRKTVGELQRLLPGYVEPTKKDPNITKRDELIFELWRTIKAEGTKGLLGRQKSKNGQSIAQRIVDLMIADYPNLTCDIVYKVIKGKKIADR